MSRAAAVHAALAAALGTRVVAARPVAGGDVNRAERVETADGRTVFVKHRAGAPAGTFRDEARGLDAIRVPGGPRVPAVIAVGDDEGARFLALEWLPPGSPGPDHDALLGRGLAVVHRAGAPAFGDPAPNRIGPLEQHNTPCDDWPRFLAERRLIPLVRRARDAGELDAGDVLRAERIVARLPELCGPAEPPARLHGDLWAGNAYAGPDGGPVLVDPATYGGHREMDLAMMRLFGGFSRAVFAAYEEVHPTAPGARERVELMQLYPLLVHVVLFGGGYRERVRAVLAAYG